MGLSRTFYAPHAVVASEHPLASSAGYDVLREGGNAFDAAVAVSSSLAVTFHPAGGLGGDFFAMLYEKKTGKVRCLNGSGWSPSGLTRELVDSKAGGTIPQFGPMTCVVPGMAAGVWQMHHELGSRDFEGLLTPSISYAENGFPAGEAFCRSVSGSYQDLSADARRVFCPSGRPTRPGELIKQRELARVLRDLSKDGPEAFYRGRPAKEIASTLSSLGVPCDLEDFSEFSPEWVQPLTLDYRGTLVYEVPPNSMGATTLLILKLLSEHDLTRAGPLSSRRIELTMKAALAAYAKRDELLGDPRFGEVDLEDFMSNAPAATRPSTRIRSGDTTAFSIADEEGNIASCIQSLFFHFGSRVFVPRCGIMLSNRGAGFNLAGPNEVRPRKRPLHTLSTLILSREGTPYLSIGTSGGDHRPMQHALFVTNAVDYSMPAEANVSHPRFLWGGGRTLIAEEGYELPRVKDYQVERLPFPGRTGVCQAVEVTSGFRKGISDVRGDGVPAGY